MTSAVLPAGVSSRRTVLRHLVGIAVAAMLPGCKAAPAPEPRPRIVSATARPPGRSRGATRIDVRQHGALGDGVHDDTAAFQRAIDALPDDGGTVTVPPGAYRIDPLRTVRLRSRMHLQLASDASLLAIPNSAARAYVLWIRLADDVEVSGGRIIGERGQHRGTTGEWGHGIQIVGASRVTVRDIRISDCWGDGICIGAKNVHGRPRMLSTDVVIDRVVSTGNRRQGLSIGGSRHVSVSNSEFSHTAGTAPQCGIDIEPDKPDATTDVRIENCRIHHNAAHGVLAYRRTHVVSIEGCTIERNRRCGVVTDGCQGVTIAGNTIRDNGSTGLLIKDGTAGGLVAGNTFGANDGSRLLRARHGFSLQGANIRIGDAASHIRVDRNAFL
jgi:parallel beta-helix repeat protein